MVFLIAVFEVCFFALNILQFLPIDNIEKIWKQKLNYVPSQIFINLSNRYQKKLKYFLSIKINSAKKTDVLEK